MSSGKEEKKGAAFIAKSVLCASLAASMSEITLPFDTSKVRLFVQGEWGVKDRRRECRGGEVQGSVRDDEDGGA